MQSSRVIKITSRQSAPITTTANLLDYEIPPGRYDLSRSYLEIQSSMTQVPTDLAQYVGRYPNVAANPSVYDNISLVRHGSLRSSSKGVIETSRHVNVRKNNMIPFADSQGKQLSHLYSGKFQGFQDRNGLMASQWRSVRKTGANGTVSKSHEHIVPLKDIFNFAKHDYYSTRRHGDLSINLEMAPESMVPYPILTDANSYVPVGYWANIEAPQTLANGVITTPAPAPAAGTDFPQPVTMSRTYHDIGQSPFFVGQLVTVSGTNVAAVDTRITLITYTPGATRTIQLTFADALPILVGPAAAMSIVTRAPVAAPTVVFPKADLVLVEVDEAPSPPDEYQYTTYKVQEDTQPTVNLNKNYIIGPLCKNVVICMPPALGAGNPRDLLAKKPVDSYRLSVNNKYVQNRLIPLFTNNGGGRQTYTGLHKTQLIKAFDNMDEGMAGPGYILPAEGALNSQFDPSQMNYSIMCPVPLTGSQKMLGVELNMNGANTVDQLFIFEETIAMLK